MPAKRVASGANKPPAVQIHEAQNRSPASSSPPVEKDRHMQIKGTQIDSGTASMMHGIRV